MPWQNNDKLPLPISLRHWQSHRFLLDKELRRMGAVRGPPLCGKQNSYPFSICCIPVDAQSKYDNLLCKIGDNRWEIVFGIHNKGV
jgi:hypothetical protein